jgi:hypothetical protein
MKAKKYAGLAILLAVALIVSVIKVVGGGDDTTVTGIIGQGKTDFFDDPEVIRILKEDYGLTVKIDREVPTYAQVEVCAEDVAELDFCWGSGENAAEQIKQAVAPASATSKVIFNSPVVLYTWAPVADALIDQGIVTKTGDTYWIVDFPKLAQMIVDGTPWSEIGLPQIEGSVCIYSTNPARSNTGYSFAAMLANTFNNGKVVDETSVNAVIPQVKTVFDCMGLLPDTTAAFFEQFLTQKMGAFPIIVAYESNLIEYSLENSTAASQALVQNEIRTLYPSTPLWSAQPLVAFTDSGKRLMDALRDPEIQRIGWEEHGFRNGSPSQPIDPSKVSVPGVPESINSAAHMPKPEVMDQLIKGIRSTPATPVAAIKEDDS